MVLNGKLEYIFVEYFQNAVNNYKNTQVSNPVAPMCTSSEHHSGILGADR